MNPPGWPGGPFLLPHMAGFHATNIGNNFNANQVHRFLATPLTQDQLERADHEHHQQGGAGDMPPQQHVAPQESNRNSSPQLLDNVHAPFPPLRQISVDMMTNWTDPDHQQAQQHSSRSTEEQQQQLRHAAAPTFDNAADSDDMAANTEALQRIIHKTMHQGDVESAGSSQKRKRSAKSMPQTWKKNVRKLKRAKGEPYQSATGKLIPAKCIKYVDCSKCRLKCIETIPDEQRVAIFDSYWGTGSYVRQRDFLCSHIIEEEKAKSTVKANRTRNREWTRQYWLPNKNGKLLRVCKSFFLATLDVGSKTIDYALKKRKGGFFCDEDQRGKHEASNKLSEEKLDFIREHIESFRSLNVSPNKKKKNGKIVLPAEYNVRKMYQMYKEKAMACNQTVLKEHQYRKIFNMEYSITFLEQKKDSTISSPDHAKFDSPGPSTHAASTAMKPSEQALMSHHNLVSKRMEQARMESNHNNHQMMKDRNKQHRPRKIPQGNQQPPPPALPQQQQQPQQQPQQQQQQQQQQQAAPQPGTSVQDHISSHVMPSSYTSAPPSHFVLPTNHSRQLDAVNMSMSQFPVHPSFLHHNN